MRSYALHSVVLHSPNAAALRVRSTSTIVRFIVFPLVPTSIRIFLLLWQVVEPARRQHFSGYSDGLPFRRLYSFLCLQIGDHIVECVQNFRFGFFETSHWLCSRRT